MSLQYKCSIYKNLYEFKFYGSPYAQVDMTSKNPCFTVCSPDGTNDLLFENQRLISEDYSFNRMGRP